MLTSFMDGPLCVVFYSNQLQCCCSCVMRQRSGALWPKGTFKNFIHSRGEVHEISTFLKYIPPWLVYAWLYHNGVYVIVAIFKVARVGLSWVADSICYCQCSPNGSYRNGVCRALWAVATPFYLITMATTMNAFVSWQKDRRLSGYLNRSTSII